MSTPIECPDEEELLALARAAVPEPRAAALSGHAAGCARCGEELAWARAEVALARRATGSPEGPSPDALFEVIAARTATATRRPVRRRLVWAGVAALAAAAAAGVYVKTRPEPPAEHALAMPPTWPPPRPSNPAPWPPPTRPSPAPTPGPSSATEALDSAAREYEGAIAQLEKDLAARPKKVTPERAERLAELRSTVDAARRDAARDPRAGTMMLRAYRGYLRTLLSTLEEA